MLEFVSILEVFIHLTESFSLSHFRIEWAEIKTRSSPFFKAGVASERLGLEKQGLRRVKISKN